MNVILLDNVENLGNVGDLVKVKAGYGRNFLLPQGKAALATPENMKAIEARRVELEQHATDESSDEQLAWQGGLILCIGNFPGRADPGR